MVLWQITSYRQAIDTELETCRAVTLLRDSYRRRWRRRAPADLVRMLPTGAPKDEVWAQIDGLAGPAVAEPPIDLEGGGARSVAVLHGERAPTPPRPAPRHTELPVPTDQRPTGRDRACVIRHQNT